MAEGAVLLGVRGRVAGDVLRAQLFLDLLEGRFELVAVVADVDEAAAGLVGDPLGGGVAAVAEAETAVEAGVGDQDDVDDDVVLLARRRWLR